MTSTPPSPPEPDRPVQPEPQATGPSPPESHRPHPERPEDEARPDDDSDAPRGIDTLPRAGQSPGKPDSTEASAAQDDAQPPRYGSKLV